MKKQIKNFRLPQKKKRVVFMGNSITEGWVGTHPEFFNSKQSYRPWNQLANKPQTLMRFYGDVVAFQPKAVVINAGTNDVAENTGAYHPEFTLNNIKAMASIAEANGIKVILTSVLPASQIKWRLDIKDAPQKIIALNKEIEAYAKANKYGYVDYFSAMKDEKNGLPEKLSKDGVHPNGEGYKIMEKLVKEEIKKIVK
ncbi:MAG: GDSL-type esterase/lipase family protein [Coprobacter fastidiosus]